MKFKKLLWITGCCTLMLLSTSPLEAASGKTGNTSNKIYIGDNPANFTFMTNGKPDPKTAEGIMNWVDTGLWEVSASSECSRPYGSVGSENPKIMEAIEREINFSQSIYADPATRLKRNFRKATHLLKGNGTLGKGRMTLDVSIEDRQGNITAQAKVSGPEKDFLKLIDEAAISLGNQMCLPKPKPKPKPNVKTSCPYLWNVTFEQSGTVNSNSCFGSGLSGNDAISTVKGHAYFPKVLIWPSFSYDPTMREETVCDPYEKNDVYHYSAKSQGDTYQKIDGFDGIDADVVSLRVSKIHGGEWRLHLPYGSVLMNLVQSKTDSFKSVEERSSFTVSDRCSANFTFSPVPVYGN